MCLLNSLRSFTQIAAPVPSISAIALRLQVHSAVPPRKSGVREPWYHFCDFGVTLTSAVRPVLMRYLHVRVLLDHEIAFLACAWLWAQPLWACVNKEHAHCLQPSNGSRSSLQGVLDLLECASTQHCCFSTWGHTWYRGVDLEEYVYRVG